MKKNLTLLAILLSATILTSCESSEEKKIMDDLDLEIQEYLEENPEVITNEDTKTSENSELSSDKNNENPEENKNNSEEVKNEEVADTTAEEWVTLTNNISDFAKCITEKWAKMYWTEWCSHCKTQKKMFWDALKDISFTDCDANRALCKSTWITWYPTWIIWWEKFPWVQSFEKLWEETWCKLVK